MTLRNLRITAVTAIALMIGIFVQGYMDWPNQPRFSSPTLNYWFFAFAAIAFPALIAWLASSLSEKWSRRVLYGLACTLILPCLLMTTCAVLEAPSIRTTDGSYEFLSEAGYGSVTYRLYRTNCGATCAYGLDLRRERDLFFGVKLVSPLWSKYRADQGTVQISGSKIQVKNGSEILVEFSR
jgi:hypothetical protein